MADAYHWEEQFRRQLQKWLYVRKNEQKIKFGNPGDGPWQDIEADEVDLRKEEVVGDGNVKKAQWNQWAGIVQRGKPSSRLLFKTTAKQTKFRAPGPGPISKRDWTPMAEKWLKGRWVFVHMEVSIFIIYVDDLLLVGGKKD